MNTGTKKNLIWLILAAATLVAAILLFIYKGSFLPDNIPFENEEFDWEGAHVSVRNRQLTVYSDGKRRYEMPFSWNVQTCSVGDIDRDGRDELLAVVWKRGSFGEHLPFWVQKNDHDFGQHIYIYKWQDVRPSGMKPIWMSSTIPFYIRDLAVGSAGNVYLYDGQSDSPAIYSWRQFGLKSTSMEPPVVSYIAGGDQILHDKVIRYGLSHQDDFSYLYEPIANLIGSADFASLNQETVYTDSHDKISDYPRFASPVEVAASVKSAGFDLVSLATNHVLDRGQPGVIYSLEADEQAGLLAIGAHKEEGMDAEDMVTFTEVKGVTLGLLSCTYGVNGDADRKVPGYIDCFRDEEKLIEALCYARENADCVILYAHWGEEYSSTVSDEQRRIAQLCAENNVDVIIGTHPHVVQPMEWISGSDGHKTLVYYSLGNLISNPKEKQCLKGALASFEIVNMPGNASEIINEKIIPTETILSEKVYVQISE